MIELLTDRNALSDPVEHCWSCDGANLIDDSNNAFGITPGIVVKVSHRRSFRNHPALVNHVLLTTQAPGQWEGNFQHGEVLLETDELTARDGPLVISFHDAASGDPVGVHAVGANIQSCTFGEFTARIEVVELNGALDVKRARGDSDDQCGTAIFVGAKSSSGSIHRIEYRTTNIVENGHAPFDKRGFAINRLSVQL